MPDFHYEFHQEGCAGGISAPLIDPHSVNGNPGVIRLGYAELMNAQLRLGVYPGIQWNHDEIAWRVYAFMIGFDRVASAGGLPGGPPPIHAAPQAPTFLPNAAFAQFLPPSEVARKLDSTEKGQIGYHVGTAVGGALATYLNPMLSPTTCWFAFHLSRSIKENGRFTFLNTRRPDIAAFAIDTLPPHRIGPLIVWENKGHCSSAAGSIAAMRRNLDQTRALVECLQLPNLPVGGVMYPAMQMNPPLPVAARFASMVDVYNGNYRVQVIDPPGEEKPQRFLDGNQMTGFLNAYYHSFAEIIHSHNARQQRYGKRTFHVVALPRGVTLGMDSRIIESLEGTNNMASIGKFLAEGYQELNNEKDALYVDPTGILVELQPNWGHPPKKPSVPVRRKRARSDPEKENQQYNENPEIPELLWKRVLMADRVEIWNPENNSLEEILFDRSDDYEIPEQENSHEDKDPEETSQKLIVSKFQTGQSAPRVSTDLVSPEIYYKIRALCSSRVAKKRRLLGGGPEP
ncbi:MAG: hypothetical protein CMO55_12700 [Verrucomicrobiales bacterium]|nr:hypothetical protein [Verrucomicrobiales bacterium]